MRSLSRVRAGVVRRPGSLHPAHYLWLWPVESNRNHRKPLARIVHFIEQEIAHIPPFWVRMEL